MENIDLTKTLYLHCGTHKTGTTAIQQYLNNNLTLLEKNNLIYPSIGYTKNYPYNNHGIAWEISGDPRLKFEKHNNSLKDFYKLLEKSNKDLIISSEDFQFFNIKENSYEEFCKQVNKNDYKIKVILYLRNQLDFFRGIYQIILMRARFINSNQVFKMIKESFNKLIINEMKLTIFFDYLNLIENIKDKLYISNDDIICKSYDENKNNLINSFNQIIGINENVEKDENVNIGLPQLTIELVETLNRNFYSSEIDAKSAEIAQRHILANEIFMLGKKFQIYDENIKKYFKDEFQESNNKIEKLYNLEINKFLI